ncbi:MAG: hypothetical protein Q9226_008539 [Calogaya cf. arnoldii]
MPPKKAAAAATQKKAAAVASHPSYRDMIKEAILQLKERNGSSRAAIKKYVLANNKSLANSSNVFDAQFNKAIRSGVEKGEFHMPKGSSGTVKLAKKEPASKKESDGVKKPAAAQKTATKKDATVKDAAPKKKVGAPKKATKDTATKKAPAAKKAGAKAKPTANTASKRKAPPVSSRCNRAREDFGQNQDGPNHQEPQSASAGSE